MSPAVERLLADRGVAFEVHRHAPIVGFDDAKATLPFDPAWMVKGLAFALPDGRVAIVAMRAEHRAQYKRIADALGVRRDDLRMASPDELERELDMQVGGVAPLPVNGACVLMDRGVLELERVICGTGRSDASLEIAGPDLVRAADAEVGDFTKDSQ